MDTPLSASDFRTISPSVGAGRDQLCASLSRSIGTRFAGSAGFASLKMRPTVVGPSAGTESHPFPTRRGWLQPVSIPSPRSGLRTGAPRFSSFSTQVRASFFRAMPDSRSPLLG